MIKILSFLLLILFCETDYAQLATHPFPKSESVWVWKIQAERAIYLIGELHGFKSVSDLTLSHDKANAIFKKSATRFCENISSTVKRNTSSIQSRVDPVVWGDFERNQKTVFDILKKSNIILQKISNTDLLNGLNFSHDAVFFRSLNGSLTAVSEKSIFKDSLLQTTGFLMDLKSRNDEECISIEPDNAGVDMWRNTCGDKETITQGLDLFNVLMHKPSSLIYDEKAVEALFLSTETTDSQLVEAMESAPMYRFEEKCNLVPRNKLWMERLAPYISSPGEPVAVFAGVGHILGKVGLINQLCALGYCSAKRLRTLD